MYNIILILSFIHVHFVSLLHHCHVLGTLFLGKLSEVRMAWIYIMFTWSSPTVILGLILGPLIMDAQIQMLGISSSFLFIFFLPKVLVSCTLFPQFTLLTNLISTKLDNFLHSGTIDFLWISMLTLFIKDSEGLLKKFTDDKTCKAELSNSSMGWQSQDLERFHWKSQGWRRLVGCSPWGL